MNFRILPLPCCRHDFSTSPFGVYMVQKRNIIAEFRWGGEGQHADADTAKAAMTEFLLSRKDSDALRVTLLEFQKAR